MANPQAFLVPIDMAGLQILNACFQSLATPPQNPQYGRYYLDSTDGLIKYWNGTAWVAAGAVLSVNSKTGVVVLTQDDIGDGTTYKRTHNDLTDALVSLINGALQKSGGTMTGAIAMGSNKITGLGNGTADGDAVNYGQMLTAIRENAGIFRGTYATKAALDAVAWQTTDPSAAYYVTNNDFAIVTADETHSNETWRYMYVSGTGSGTGWQAQYRINETPFTQAQLDAINSGITSALVAQIGVGSVKTATGTIGTSATSATVNFSGTLINAFATMNGEKVIVDIAPGVSSVVFSVSAAPSSAITCTVAYI